VPGGKPVHVYELGRPALSLGGGLELQTDANAWPARGKTAPLAKGPVLARNGADAAGEGLGLGVPLGRFSDGWWFPGPESALEVGADGRSWVRTYDLNRREVDDSAGHFLRFEPGPSRGLVRVTYRLGHNGSQEGVKVEVRTVRMSAGLQQVVIANEQSGAFDDYADASAKRLGGAIGSWSPVNGSWARLRSATLGVEFEVPAPPRSAQFFAAREVRDTSIDFSGLEFVFDSRFKSLDYLVAIRR
jgi:hypothetical protein